MTIRHAAIDTTPNLAGEEAANVDLFAVVSDYISGFVQTTDGFQANRTIQNCQSLRLSSPGVH